MEQSLKQKIATGAFQYAKDNSLSQNDVARLTGINAGYISNIFRNQFTNTVDNKEVPIGDRHFIKLAQWASIAIKKVYWKTIPTTQFLQTIATLAEAKENGKTAMIIGATGVGKTNGVNVFCNKNPQHTYRITVSSLYRMIDIVNELAEILGVEAPQLIGKRVHDYSVKLRVDRITNKLIEIKQNGGKPILVFDEGENMEITTLKMIKGLYDVLKDHCSIVIIGTDQLLKKLLNLGLRNRDAIPQLYRRFKAGMVTLSPLDKHNDFKPFFKEYVEDKGLQKLLTLLADNYGELNDYLEPTLKEADEKGIQLTEEFFRLKWNETRFQK